MKRSRRELFAGLASLAVPVPAWMPRDLELRDLRVPGTFSRRATLFLPKHLRAKREVPLLVLLHGLGETGDERMGAYAWVERYGLGTAYDRLRRPPIVRTARSRVDITDERLARVNAQLAREPFGGLAIVCPYLPTLAKLDPTKGPPLDQVTRFLIDTVIPRARSESSAIAEQTEIDGCSLGGFMSLEVFLRRPEFFAAWGGVQSAIGAARAPGYAERIARALARVGKRALHIETSEADAFRKGNEALSAELAKRGVDHTFRMLPGPHDQPWLREAGTLEMLLWHAQK